MIVLGIDGMDPAFVERYWAALPNLARLRDQGRFSRLGTTMPPQSPVAWSTFITGLDPSAHGIYDFVHRRPDTLQPFSSMASTEKPGFLLRIGDYTLPLSASHVIPLRRGQPFWELLSARRIPVTIIHMPINYPPAKAGQALAGMGVPDLGGTLGNFTFYTDDPTELTRSVAGGRIVKVSLENGQGILSLEGPPNSLRRDHRPVFADVKVAVDAQHPVARLISGDDVAVICQGEWSDWMIADFQLIPHLSSVRGMFRVFAKQLHPRFELYVSAVNIDPIVPALPIANRPEWARTIARETGRYYTLGIAEDTSALRQNVLDLPTFRQQARLVFEDERKLLRYSLQHYSDGFLFFYFSSIDQNSHVLWGRHEAELLEVYRAVDECVGEVWRALPDGDLIVMSDHGFASFDRAVHLNAWLKARGFLSVNGSLGGETNLSDLDWASTEIYALGLNGLYLNRKGREQRGIVVTDQQSRALIANVRAQLIAWRDPVNGRNVVKEVYETNSTPENFAVAPDLLVGYAPGYRASWQTGLGGVPKEEIEDNKDAWIADHCINFPDVPGVLFTSRKNNASNPRLQDVTASVLHLFGIPQPPSQSGRSVF